ncbi:MAG: 3-deoxy-D-manno-octulosonic acid kinase [Xanthomonadales bacterium]|nr:3-deoxy-D-manno-octulosonic acid kinase [Xanthomonadales bacterium]
MIETQVQSSGDTAIAFDRTAGIVPDTHWFEPAHWTALGRSAEAPGGRGGVAVVETPLGACVLRHYRRGGLMARLSRDRYLWTGLARTRAMREFELLAELSNQGLPVPVPVAARIVRDGARYRGDLLTRRIDGSQTLAALLDAGRADAAVAKRIGAMLARFHAARVWHADLNAHNILVDAAGDTWLIDFDRGRKREPRLAWQQANLARLRRSLEKLGAVRRDGFDGGFWHPLLAAYHDGLARAESPEARA